MYPSIESIKRMENETQPVNKELETAPEPDGTSQNQGQFTSLENAEVRG